MELIARQNTEQEAKLQQKKQTDQVKPYQDNQNAQ